MVCPNVFKPTAPGRPLLGLSSGNRIGNVVGVMFDWDGVLLDSLGASFNVYNKVFTRLGTKQLTRDEFYRTQSPNWYEFYEKVGVPKTLWGEVDETWVRLYREEDPALYPDAMDCLGSLKRLGFRLALVSNGSTTRVESELVRFGLAPLFESILCGEKQEELKPSPIMLERTLRVLGLGPQEVVYVGDAPADVQAARNARVPIIAVARGPIQAERLRAEHPDRVLGGLSELTDLLAGVV